MSFQKRLGVFCVRIAVILLVSGGLLLIPEANNGELLHYKNAIVSLLTVIMIGVVLYDTLFYDRQRW